MGIETKESCSQICVISMFALVLRHSIPKRCFCHIKSNEIWFARVFPAARFSCSRWQKFCLFNMEYKLNLHKIPAPNELQKTRIPGKNAVSLANYLLRETSCECNLHFYCARLVSYVISFKSKAALSCEWAALSCIERTFSANQIDWNKWRFSPSILCTKHIPVHFMLQYVGMQCRMNSRKVAVARLQW